MDDEELEEDGGGVELDVDGGAEDDCDGVLLLRIVWAGALLPPPLIVLLPTEVAGVLDASGASKLDAAVAAAEVEEADAAVALTDPESAVSRLEVAVKTTLCPLAV